MDIFFSFLLVSIFTRTTITRDHEESRLHINNAHSLILHGLNDHSLDRPFCPMSARRGSIALAACASGAVLYYAGKRFLLQKNGRASELTGNQQHHADRKPIPRANRIFFRQLLKLLKISIPSVLSKEFGYLVLHTMSLVSRTFLSIYVAQLDGRIVKSIVEGDKRRFWMMIVNWILVAIPATFINSLIRYLECKLALAIRTRLVKHFYKLYFTEQTYYRVSNLDSRLVNADHSLTEDLQAFSSSVAHLYSHISKPLLDVVLMTGAVARMARKRGENSPYPGLIAFTTIASTACILKVVAPPFGKLVADEARKNGYLRYLHSRIIANAEEIAFYAGHMVSAIFSLVLHVLEFCHQILNAEHNSVIQRLVCLV